MARRGLLRDVLTSTCANAQDRHNQHVLSKPTLHRTVVGLVDALDARAASISQMLGDVLLQVVEHVPGGGTLERGHGYLVSDYPLTRHVLTAREPRAVSATDPGADEAEARLLRALGYDALLMVPVVVGEFVWGLAEVYDSARTFAAEDARTAEDVVAAAIAR